MSESALDSRPPEILHFVVDGMRCASCLKSVEEGVTRVPGVRGARANLTTGRLRVEARPGDEVDPTAVVAALARDNRLARVWRPDAREAVANDRQRALTRAVAVAGFAAGNVMLISAAIWAGEASGDMGAATRDFLHWVSAAITLPAVAIAGRPFYRSALGALRAGGMNMDVPISLAVLAAAGVSLAETALGGEHAFFDAAVTLLFFLLLGRLLDEGARRRANRAAEQMTRLAAREAIRLTPDGGRESVAIDALCPGDVIHVAPGERIPADGAVRSGQADIDSSLLTGESLPCAVGPGDPVHAGTLCLDAPLRVRVSASGEGTLLADIVRLMEASEQGRARYVRIADRVARIYAPAVHLLAGATLLLWLGALGADWRTAALTAIAVLIVTCPCALALAVPVAQVVATGALFRRGILVKAGDALERLGEVDLVVFDKTGTLSEGRPRLRAADGHPAEILRAAARLAAESRHPLARALAREAAAQLAVTAVRETPGRGLEAELDGRTARLGSRAWCGVDDPDEGADDGADDGPELWFRWGEAMPHRFRFEDRLRVDAAETVARLRARGLDVALLSGDRPATVERVARAVGIDTVGAGMRPDEKVAWLERAAAAGRRVAMVGDGLNDAPALRAAHVSISPAEAADIARAAADLVFQGDRLAAVVQAHDMARRSGRIVRSSFAVAFAYNAVAVPLAMAGLVTPLLAAVLMSASSLLVTANAFRLRRVAREDPS